MADPRVDSIRDGKGSEMANQFTLGLYLSTAIGLGLATPGFAQSSPDQTATSAAARQSDADSATGDIIVTARRTEERLQDVPISITVFSQEQLSQRNVVTATDLATYTPSLTSNARYGDQTASFAIRGFTQDSYTSPSVAVYFADVVAPRAQPNTGGGNGIGVGAFFDLQNVQVLKGPQGTLFGRNTTGGAILLVPRKPTSDLEGYVEGSIGNYNMRRFEGVINIPVSDTIRFRAGVNHQKSDGYIQNKSGIGPEDFSDTNYIAARASLAIDLAPNLENYTIVTYSRSNSHGMAQKIVVADGGFSTCGGPSSGAALAPLFASFACAQILRQQARGDGFYDVENNNQDPHLLLKQLQLINTTTWAVSDTMTIKNIASYQTFKQGQSINLNADNFSLGGQPLGVIDLYQDPARYNIAQWTGTEELQLQGRTTDDSLVYQVGAYYEQSGPIGGYGGTLASIFMSCTDTPALLCSNPLGFGFVNSSLTKTKFRNIGLYAQASYKLTDQLSVTGGIRYTIDKTSAVGATRVFQFLTPNTPTAVCANGNPGTSAAILANPDICTVSFSQDSKRPTWLIDIDYKPADDILLYAKYARGYRQGGINVSNTIPNAWGPEKVDNFEIGAKTSFRGAMPGYFNVAAFLSNFSNQQLQATLIPDGSNPLASPAATILNGGQSRIKGIEADAQISPFSGLVLNAGYAFLDTELRSVNFPLIPGYLPPLANASVGGPLVLTPRHKLTMTASYTLPLDESIGRVSVSATYTYTAKQLIGTPAQTPLNTLPATNLLNLNLGWSSIAGSPIDLALFATNVTNEKYQAYSGTSYASFGYDSYILGQPRMFGMRIKYRFGQ